MSKSNDGRYLENYTEEWFTNQARIDMACNRLPDTRSARNIIKAQNADFYCSTLTQGGFYLECKSVGGKKMILRHFRQYPGMYRWAQAGTPGYVLIHYHELDKILIVDVSKLGELKGKQWAISEWLCSVDGGSKEDLFRLLDMFMGRKR